MAGKFEISQHVEPAPGSKAEITQQLAAAIQLRDMDTLAKLLAPECEIVPLRAAVEHTVYRGPNALAEWFAAQDDVWEDLRAQGESWQEGPDWVLGLGRIRARGRHSGAPLDVEAAWICRFRGRHITSIRVYTNRADALAALGLGEEVNS